MRSLLIALALLCTACGSEPEPAVSAPGDPDIIDEATVEAYAADKKRTDDEAPAEISAEAAGEESAPLVDPGPGIEPDAPGDTPIPPPGWPGRYMFVEGAQIYTYTYELTLNNDLVGTVDVIGPQVETRYAVRGEPTVQGLNVVLTGFRPNNLSTLIDPGQTLFELRWADAGDQGDEIGDRILMTHWREMSSTGVEGSEPVQIAFTPAG